MEKTKKEIRDRLLQDLAMNVGINTQEDGSIAVAIVDALIDEIYGLYYQLDLRKEQAYLSTSTGEYTQLIAELVGVDRLDYETDDDFKLRTVNAVHTHALGNKVAIEEAARAVPGVASIDYQPFASGTGSFVLYVYPQPGTNQVRLLHDVEQALKQVVAEGIYYEVRQPKEKPVNVSLVVQFDNHISVTERQRVRNTIRQRLIQYLNNMNKDEVLYINELISQAMNVSDHILDLRIMTLEVNGLKKTLTNTFPDNNERFIAGQITIG